ncbi:Sulfotransferase [Trinorchestia longiramus]|nr:Sulfotransferase [Trinorchestia longiramus]
MSILLTQKAWNDSPHTNHDWQSINQRHKIPSHQMPDMRDEKELRENDLLRIVDKYPDNNQAIVDLSKSKPLGLSGQLKVESRQPDESKSKRTEVNTPEDPNTVWEKEQISRKRKLQTVCDVTAAETAHKDIKALVEKPNSLSNILVDDEHKVLYCYVPKVACTQWKQVFLSLTGKWNNSITKPHNFYHNKAFELAMNKQSFSEEEIMTRLRTYKSFMFSRDPLERILSAYRDKFEGKTDDSLQFIRIHAKHMLHQLKRNSTFLKTSNVSSLRFQDMMDFIVRNPPQSNQEHWKPAYHLCHPCTLNYTYLGRFDDLYRDSTQILSRIAGKENIQFPKYPNMPSAIRLVSHSEELPIIVLPETWNLDTVMEKHVHIEAENILDDENTRSIAESSSGSHLLHQAD